jgi:MFS family permease
VQLVVLFSVFAALAVLAVRLAEVIPQLEADQFGWLLSVGSVGMGLGALVVGQFGQGLSRTRLAKIGTIGMGTALLGLALWHETLTPTLIAIGILGLFAAFVGIPMQTAIQEQTPETMRGKVFGLQNNAVNIALSLPLALAGIAESLWGLGVTLTGLAIALALGGIPLWIRSEAKNPGE